jgi:hypothetical protein
MATAAFILSLHGCNVPSLRDLDIPPASGKSTLVLLPSLVNLTPGATFIFTASGGRPPYTFAPSGNFEVLNGGTTAKYTAPSAGTYIVSVTDADGYTTESTVMVTGSIPLSVSPSVVTVLAGSIVTLIASGGDGSYSFILLDGSGTLTQQTGEEDNKADYESAGAETATIEVVSASRHVYAWITSTTPSGTLQISPYAVSMTTGQELTFSAINATGTPTFSVVAGTGTIDPETGIFTAPPVEELGGIVRVTDDVGQSDATIDVYYPLTIVPTDVYVETNGTYTFTASGGKEDYHFYIESGGGTIEELTGVYSAPGSSGSATVKVMDDLGNTSYATVHVYAPSSYWSIDSVDTDLKSGQYASLALDGDDNPHVAYYESTGKELRLASRNGSEWSSQVVDGTTGSVGLYPSLTIDTTTTYPSISYYDADPRNRDLRYRWWNGSSWLPSTDDSVVDDTGTVGLYTSLALDPTTHFPRISYYDSTNRDLKYASWNGSGWDVVTVDSTGDVGKYSSLALDSTTGWPRIAYYDATNKKLKFASWDGSSWQITNPDDGTNRGEYCSLAVDAAGNPHISYFEASTTALRYAWNDGTWHSQEVDGSNDRGMYSSIALDPSTGHPRISYFDNTLKKLIFVSHNGSSWDSPIGAIDPSQNVGMYSSLRLKSNGKAVIAYYNNSAQDLKVAEQP